MEKQGITPVAIIQELLAILATRQEAAGKLAVRKDAGELSTPINGYTAQTENYIAELQTELSEYGDAVMADVDRDNAYHALWKQTLETEDTESAKESEQRFIQMEDELKKIYNKFSDSQMHLPESLNALLQRQREGFDSIPD